MPLSGISGRKGKFDSFGKLPASIIKMEYVSSDFLTILPTIQYGSGVVDAGPL